MTRDALHSWSPFLKVVPPGPVVHWLSIISTYLSCFRHVVCSFYGIQDLYVRYVCYDGI
jgi:hypothetical protein